nr:transposase [Pontibacter actiniarum]
MKKSKFTKAQIILAIKQAETGTKVEEVCRKMGIRRGYLLELEEEVRWFRSVGTILGSGSWRRRTFS